MDDLNKLETYNYFLPKELIAQYPKEKRDESRLLCFKKEKKHISHHIFSDLPDLLSSNDVLVLNNTKVIPARFFARTGGNKEVEILLVSSSSPDSLIWKVLANPRKHLEKIKYLNVEKIMIEVIDTETIEFNNVNDLKFILNQIGVMPLPPYIKRTGVSANRRTGEGEFNDFERYQTVFASEPGAVAAPTAALHFTNDLLKKIKQKGVEIFYITLHVGPGTFLPIRSENINEHKIIPESFYIDQDIWYKILKAKKNKKRIIAVGSTVVRALEYAAIIDKFSGLTGLYVTPGFEFKVTDALITNFHLPKTTLLVLVSAFIGWENVKKIYEEAIEEKYRFYSYGDGMFLS